LRFCWPVTIIGRRARARARLLAKARAWRSKTDKIGLVSNGVCDHPEISEILQGCGDGLSHLGFFSGVSINLDELLDALVESRDQQMRRAGDRIGSPAQGINKNLTR